jgi:hypothetical protein
MGFELLLLIVIGVCVYLHLIPNDLLIVAIGVVIRGALSNVPSVAALNANTEATKENTLVTQLPPERKATNA